MQINVTRQFGLGCDLNFESMLMHHTQNVPLVSVQKLTRFCVVGWMARLWRHCLSQNNDGEEFLQRLLIEMRTQACSIHRSAERSRELAVSITGDCIVTAAVWCHDCCSASPMSCGKLATLLAEFIRSSIEPTMLRHIAGIGYVSQFVMCMNSGNFVVVSLSSMLDIILCSFFGLGNSQNPIGELPKLCVKIRPDSWLVCGSFRCHRRWQRNGPQTNQLSGRIFSHNLGNSPIRTNPARTRELQGIESRTKISRKSELDY